MELLFSTVFGSSAPYLFGEFYLLNLSLAFIGFDDYTEKAVEAFENYLNSILWINNAEKLSTGHYNVELSVMQQLFVIGSSVWSLVLPKHQQLFANVGWNRF